MPEENVNQFLDSGVQSKARIHFFKQLLWYVLIFWVAGLILLFVVGRLLSSYTLRTVESRLKNNNNQRAHFLRRVYRLLINFAGIYYYISLPVILILLLALVAGIFYLFLYIGQIPIKLMLLLVIGALVSVYGMIRSLLVKVNHEDPGRELKYEEAPELFELTKEVALQMGTRPIDEIRITPETDLAVYEKGSWKEKLQDKSKRILILGAGVLKDFRLVDFKTVIAHEYGHFSHRDTAGGAVALRVRNDMYKYYIALFQSGQAVWWNLAFWFLRLYHFIFIKISHGSSRLQEILADRVAAQTYGANAFKSGLTHVIRRNIEFVKLARSEIKMAKAMNRPFLNLYDINPSENNKSIEEELQQSLQRETTEEDTHPSPNDRFRFIEGLGPLNELLENKSVPELFTDWTTLTEEMTKNIEESWKGREIEDKEGNNPLTQISEN